MRRITFAGVGCLLTVLTTTLVVLTTLLAVCVRTPRSRETEVTTSV